MHFLQSYILQPVVQPYFLEQSPPPPTLKVALYSEGSGSTKLILTLYHGRKRRLQRPIVIFRCCLLILLIISNCILSELRCPIQSLIPLISRELSDCFCNGKALICIHAHLIIEILELKQVLDLLTYLIKVGTYF